MSPPTTVLVFGDQLNRRIGALGAATPRDHSILLVESDQLLRPTRHRQRLHFVVAAMRRFAAGCERHSVGTVASNQFLCHERAFAEWAEGRRRLRMEDFYRWHRLADLDAVSARAEQVRRAIRDGRC